MLVVVAAVVADCRHTVRFYKTLTVKTFYEFYSNSHFSRLGLGTKKLNLQLHLKLRTTYVRVYCFLANYLYAKHMGVLLIQANCRR